MQYEDEEVWKFVENTNNYYSVSSHGRVRSEARVILRKDDVPMPVPERILTPAHDNKGYPVVSICLVTSKKVMKIHRLVAQAFCEKPEGCDVVNHIDNTVSNNHFSNLEWTTVQGNVTHRENQGRGHQNNPKHRKNHHAASKTLSLVIEIRRLLRTHSRKQVSETTKIPLQEVGRIDRKDRWNFPEAFPEYYEAL